MLCKYTDSYVIRTNVLRLLDSRIFEICSQVYKKSNAIILNRHLDS